MTRHQHIWPLRRRSGSDPLAYPAALAPLPPGPYAPAPQYRAYPGFSDPPGRGRAAERFDRLEADVTRMMRMLEHILAQDSPDPGAETVTWGPWDAPDGLLADERALTDLRVAPEWVPEPEAPYPFSVLDDLGALPLFRASVHAEFVRRDPGRFPAAIPWERRYACAWALRTGAVPEPDLGVDELMARNFGAAAAGMSGAGQ